MAETTLKPAGGATTPAAADDPRAVTAAPRVDVLETDEEFVLLADLPGVRPDDVDVRFENGELTVHARRTPSHPDKVRGYAEADATAYFRPFRVAEQVAADRITAELRNGVLALKLPKVDAVKPRRIAVAG